MPEASAHIAKAEHNEKFAAVIRGLSTEFLDWVVTAYFYAALHYLEAYLAANPMERHPSMQTSSPSSTPLRTNPFPF
jgi:hypothetical protein